MNRLDLSNPDDRLLHRVLRLQADQVGDDTELLAKVVPDYVCLGTRTLQDNGSWLGAWSARAVGPPTRATRRRPGLEKVEEHKRIRNIPTDTAAP